MKIFETSTRTSSGASVVLNFLTNPDIPQGYTGLLSVGLITSHPGLGATLGQGKGALSIIFPKVCVPEDYLRVAASKNIQDFERAVHAGRSVEPTALGEALVMSQHMWVSKEYHELAERYFNGDAEATYAWRWGQEPVELDNPYCQYYQLEDVEVLLTGVPNGHPSWDGNHNLS